MNRKTITIEDVELELHDGGSGPALFFLHSGQGFDPGHPYVEPLTRTHRVIAPSHPGFGASGLPDWIDRPDDIAHLYLSLLDQLELDRVDVIGCSIGGWIAAEMATMVPERIGKLVLVGPAGVKTGSPDTLDIPDIYVMPPAEVPTLMFHDPSNVPMDPSKLSDEELAISVRNRETLALLVWEPYMHNPKLVHRLHRARMPTLLIRGVSDGLISQDYLERYAELFPDARIETIHEAGHAPQVEQPERFAQTVGAFLAA